MVAFISFLYDPNLSLILKDIEVAGLIYQGKLIFLDSRTVFRKLFNLLGIPITERILDPDGRQHEAVKIRNHWQELLLKADYSLRSGFSRTSSRNFKRRIIEVVS